MALSKGDRVFSLYGRSGFPSWRYGELTAIETDYLANSYLNDRHERIYKVNGEDMTHDQIGENIVLWNIEQFTGRAVGELYDLQAEVFRVTDDHLYYQA